MRTRPAHGFTLIEMLTVIAIAGVLAALSAVALSQMRQRGDYASATGDFMQGLRAARAEAYARGNPTVMVVDSQGGRWWALEDAPGNGSFDFASFDPANPAPSPDRLIASGTLPSSASFGPPAGWGTALSPPLSGIPTGYVTTADGGTADISTDGGSSAPNYKYCSFCSLSNGYGAITFLPGGGAQFSGGPLTVGQQISIQNVSRLSDGGTSAKPTGIIDYAIVGATGAVQAVTIQ